MKRILCFGDSNTWGYMPGSGRRYPEEIRWPSRLQILLGSEYRIIAEGLSGRTTDLDKPGEHFKNGLAFVDAALSMHKPLDLVILMLGTNDLKTRYQRDENDIAAALASLVQEINAYLFSKTGSCPKILLLSPAPILDAAADGPFGSDFDARSVIVSQRLGEALKNLSQQTGTCFLDMAQAEVSPVDGIHLTARGHMAIAAALYSFLQEIDLPEKQKEDHALTFKTLLESIDPKDRLSCLPVSSFIHRCALADDAAFVPLFHALLAFLYEHAHTHANGTETDFLFQDKVLYRCPSESLPDLAYWQEKAFGCQETIPLNVILDRMFPLLYRTGEKQQ